MKRIWIAVIILTICAGMCAAEQAYIKSFCTDLDRLVSVAESEPSKENLTALHKYWNGKNDLLYAMCEHGILDEISNSIHEASTTKDDEIIESALTSVKAHNHTFYENQRITFSNIA